MTGYGSANLNVVGIRGSVEIKSLNHRYFDIAYFLSSGLTAVEHKIRPLILKSIHRGRVTVSVKISPKSSKGISINKEGVKQYLKHAESLHKEFGFKNDLSLSDIMKLPGIVVEHENVIEIDELWPEIEKCLIKVLSSLEKMRMREGQSISRDLSNNLKKMQKQIKMIQSRSKKILIEKKKNLTDEEFGSYQKSTDIHEENTRLTHYIEEFKSLLKTNGPIGKKMDFIAQEMQRETNTIGSKVQDGTISNAVIALKSKIEKIREQAQNVE